MSDELEVTRGSDNVFRDLGLPEAETKLIKADLAAEILRILDERGLSVREAATLVGVNYADISRIRNADLRRFTIDRLVTVLHRLDKRVELRVLDREHHAVA
jgi:predicted XRE-type DNA-binding protein